MRKLYIFLIILVVSLAVLLTLALVSWYISVTAPSSYGSSWIGEMWNSMGLGSNSGSGNNYGGMGGMMGSGGYYGATAPSPSYLWVIPVVLIAVVAAALIGVGFYLTFPELRYIRGRGPCNPSSLGPGSSAAKNNAVIDGGVAGSAVSSVAATSSVLSSSDSASASNCDILLKTMTPEEQKVINVLINHHGKYLQKYVVKETGLSRLKTHRVVARFAQRGIVSVKEFGNTNEIVLSDWVKSPNGVRSI